MSTIPFGALHASLEDLERAVKPKLALLMRWSEAEQYADRGGTNTPLEQLAFRGMEDLCRDILRGVEQVQRAADLLSVEDSIITPPRTEGER